MRLGMVALGFLLSCAVAAADDGSRLWLRQEGGGEAEVSVGSSCDSPTVEIAVRELERGWRGSPVSLSIDAGAGLPEGGYVMEGSRSGVNITASSPIGLLYGAYGLLRMQACGVKLRGTVRECPAFGTRMLNHWDNLDGTVERGYAGRSLWDWEALPDSLSERYVAYARANASIGINGTVLNNVNASPSVLSTDFLRKVAALASVFRPYGIKVWLSVNFSSPMVLGGLSTADPLDGEVRSWWRGKVAEIYGLIPDFGGFLVKANSEGQPGPCDYGRTHAEGANMLAEALGPFGGQVIWRAFVYSPSDADRAKQAYAEFMPLDGDFLPNVTVQIKNGPIDFQPREPYSPLFTGLRRTSMAAELQITQEYLGASNHLVYLAPLWKEFFGFVKPSSLAAVAGVANTGTADNWCGHTFAQANWYSFGRLAWNPSLTAEEVAGEWVSQTFGLGRKGEAVVDMMLESREAAVDYMMPLGLHHIFAYGHHYGPQPWCEVPGARPDWLPSYYHRADTAGIGFDRSHAGSDAVAQYPDSLRGLYDDPRSCPEQYLLWFHHLPWTWRMQDGDLLWNALCRHYERGVRKVEGFVKAWDSLEGRVDAQRFSEVREHLKIQLRDALWWKDACILYFQRFSGLPIPDGVRPPTHDLEALERVSLPISNFECPTGDMLDAVR